MTFWRIFLVVIAALVGLWLVWFGLRGLLRRLPIDDPEMVAVVIIFVVAFALIVAGLATDIFERAT